MLKNSEIILRNALAHPNNISHHRQGNLRRCLAADIQADGHSDSLNLLFVQPANAQQALPAFLRGAQGAHYADVESVGFHCFHQGGVVNFWIVGEGDHSCGAMAAFGAIHIEGSSWRRVTPGRLKWRTSSGRGSHTMTSKPRLWAKLAQAEATGDKPAMSNRDTGPTRSFRVAVVSSSITFWPVSRSGSILASPVFRQILRTTWPWPFRAARSARKCSRDEAEAGKCSISTSRTPPQGRLTLGLSRPSAAP